jgi:hypothetical protein
MPSAIKLPITRPLSSPETRDTVEIISSKYYNSYLKYLLDQVATGYSSISNLLVVVQGRRHDFQSGGAL